MADLLLRDERVDPHRPSERALMKLYYADAMRGHPLYNWPKFEAAAKVLRAKGHEVVNPTEIDEALRVVDVVRSATGKVLAVTLSDLFDFDTVIGRDLEEVVCCDGIVLGPDWEHSQGARKEWAAAVAAGLAIFYGVESVPDEMPPGEPMAYTPDLYPILDAVDQLRHQQRIASEQVPYDDATAWAGSLTKLTEVRVIDPETGGAKGSKLARFDLLPPDAMWAVAEHFGRGAMKYSDRNWESGYRWGLSYAALQRHLTEFWAGEDIDTETGGFHLAAAAVHCLFLLTFQIRGAGTDDRTKTL
jgi:dATP/dGTP diphosphohydrolase/uncharacterized protein DUF4406